MKFSTRHALAFGIASVLAAMAPARLCADDGDGKEGRRCSNATLRGDYGLHATGIRPVAGAPGQSETHATLALRTYDGNGRVNSLSVASHGLLTGVRQGLEITGTYEVQANCTGTVKLYIPGRPNPIEASFVIVDNGRQIKEVPTSPGDIGIALLERQ